MWLEHLYQFLWLEYVLVYNANRRTVELTNLTELNEFKNKVYIKTSLAKILAGYFIVFSFMTSMSLLI